MPGAGRLPQRVLRVARPWTFLSCPARRGAPGHDLPGPRGFARHLRDATGACRAGGRRMPGGAQAGRSAHARVGLGRGQPAPGHAHHARGAQSTCGSGPGGTSIPRRCTEPNLGSRYHLRADLDRVRVLGHRARCVQPQGGGMGHGPPSAHRTGARGAEHGDRTTPPRGGCPSFRPGRPIHFARLWQSVPGDGRDDLDGIGRRLLR